MGRRSWTHAEHQALAAFYPAISAERLRELLPKRSLKAIRQEAYDLGLKKCDARRAEAGRENVLKRHHPAVFKTPTPPEQ